MILISFSKKLISISISTNSFFYGRLYCTAVSREEMSANLNVFSFFVHRERKGFHGVTIVRRARSTLVGNCSFENCMEHIHILFIFKIQLTFLAMIVP